MHFDVIWQNNVYTLKATLTRQQVQDKRIDTLLFACSMRGKNDAKNLKVRLKLILMCNYGYSSKSGGLRIATSK